MNFDFTEEQLAIRDAITKLCADFPAEYWLKCDNEGHYPEEFAAAVVAVAVAVAGALWYFLQPLSAAEIEAATTRVLAQATFLPGVAPAATRAPVPPTVALSSLAPTPVPTPVPVPTSVPKPTAAPIR